MNPLLVVGLCLGCVVVGLLVGRRTRSQPGRTLDATANTAPPDGEAKPHLSVLEDREGHLGPGPGRGPESAAIVRAEGLVKTYRTADLVVPALRGVDLDIGRGEFVALVGPSGNGKSTLLNCLSGIEPLDRGRVWVEGEELQRMSLRQRAAHRAEHMGFVFQSFNLVNVLSAQENVELPLLIAGVKQREARRRSGELLDRVGLGARRDHRPTELSGGEQQRVAVARALVTDPAVIWADEPTGNLDSVTAATVVELFEEVNAAGQTVVLVTHDPAIAARADRVIRIVDGRIADDGRRGADAGTESAVSESAGGDR